MDDRESEGRGGRRGRGGEGRREGRWTRSTASKLQIQEQRRRRRGLKAAPLDRHDQTIDRWPELNEDSYVDVKERGR